MTALIAHQADAPADPWRARDAVRTADEIMRMLPHRHPFLLLDRIVALEPGVSASAIKNISVSEGVLAGHFPGRMLYPGVLLIECIAQLAAVVYGAEAEQALPDGVGEGTSVADRVGYLAEVRNAKFLRPTFPGDQLVVQVASGPRVGNLISVTGQVSVDGELALTARLAVSQRPPAPSDQRGPRP
jgi:3-hydroxyacyl-[acyl-carrier-protein] dehydratase